MARILVLNNYDSAATWRAVERREVPDHQLFGLNHFKAHGHEVAIAPWRSSRRLAKTTAAIRRSPLPLGDLEQQWSAVRSSKWADLIYVPSSQADIQVLGYMRSLGVFPRPIVCVMHHPVDRGRLAVARRPAIRALLNGIDAYPALSRGVAEELRRKAPEHATRTGVLRWGPDADFYAPAPDSGDGVLAVGRMARDFTTLAAGASMAGVPTRIVCSADRAPTKPSAACVSVTLLDGSWDMGWPALLRAYAEARIVAIPLAYPPSTPLRGLSGLLDALAMAKPVVMTRHPLIDLDPVALGFGLTVEPGDAAGWASALERLNADPPLAHAMGRRGRELVDGGLNSAAFAADVLRILERVLAQ